MINGEEHDFRPIDDQNVIVGSVPRAWPSTIPAASSENHDAGLTALARADRIEQRPFYHVTPARNLPAIMRDELIPKIGRRSRKLKEPVAGVHLFDSIDAAEDAVANWLGDEFGKRPGSPCWRSRCPGTRRPHRGQNLRLSC